jgi:hypothetical protein
MNWSWARLAVICLFISALGILPGRVVQAQSNDLSIGLIFPNEGETFYAGPSTFIYSFKIRGWVESTSYSSEEIKIEIQIFQGDQLTHSKMIKPDENGLFTLATTVNPDATASFGQFQTSCRIECHFGTDFQLSKGPVLLQIVATTPDGHQEKIQRHITVDWSEYAKIPVQVMLENGSVGLPGDIPVQASARLYLWRTRNRSAITNENGQAVLEVEALSQSPTRYIFRVEPIIIDGISYEGIEPVEVILPPGATSSPLVILSVRTLAGEINGLITGPDGLPVGSMELRAIQMPEGLSQTVKTAADGTYSIRNLKIGQYILSADPALLTPQGFAFSDTLIDLTGNPKQTVNVSLAPVSGREWHGSVMDDQGNVVPFAWISLDALGTVIRNQPGDGSFALYDLPAQSESMVFAAPGYYSQTHWIDFANTSQPVSVELSRRPDTISLPWGDGEIVIPSESVTENTESGIRLINGWIWGYSQITVPMKIQALDLTISLSKGNFALEYEPVNGQGWLYVIDGEAEIIGEKIKEPIKVVAGQMAILVEGRAPLPISFDPLVFSALQGDQHSVIQPFWEPTLIARIRDRVARIGVGTAQILTLVIYGTILVSIVLVPLFGLYWFLKKPRKNGGG